MTVNEAVKAIMMDLEGYFGIEPEHTLYEVFKVDITRYLKTLHSSAYHRGCADTEDYVRHTLDDR